MQPLILPGKMKKMTLGFQHNRSVFKLDSAQFIHEFIIVPLLDLFSEGNVYVNRKAQLCLRMSTAVQQPFGGLGGYRYKKRFPIWHENMPGTCLLISSALITKPLFESE